jgi:glycerol uptake facilitator protein
MTDLKSSAAQPQAVPREPSLFGEMVAEFAGTAVLILFGVGVVAQVLAGKNGDDDAIHWSWGFGVVFGVYVAGRTTGAHINPAVTLAMAVFKGFPWRKVVPYWIAQFIGAFIASLIIRWVYSGPIAATDPGHTFTTQRIFSTLPGDHVTVGFAFLDQVVGTAILLFLIFAVTELRATPPGANLAPFIIGLIVVAIGMAWGSNAGYAINPARDFGPRLMSYFTGYSTAMREPGGAFYFWVPIIGPFLGAVLGGGLYRILVEPHLPREGEIEAQPAGRLPSDDD